MRQLYEVELRRAETGETLKKRLFAQSRKEAEAGAVERARRTHASSMAEREYGRFDVIGCSVSNAVRSPE
jgi:hypothetical protein